MKFLFAIFIQLLAATIARANTMVDFTGSYETDSFVTTVNAASSKIYYSLDALFEVDKSGRLYAGLHAHQFSFSEKPVAATTTLNSTDLGAQVLYFFDKKETFFISGGYNFSVKGEHSDGVTKSDLSGFSYQAGLGYLLEYSQSISLGLKWNYLSENYTKSSGGSYSRVLIFPALTFVWHN